MDEIEERRRRDIAQHTLVVQRALHLKKAFKHVKKQFDIIDIGEHHRYMNAVDKRLPKGNMHKHYRSQQHELGLAKALGLKYVGDKPDWEADFVFPREATSPTEKHFKYESKASIKMFHVSGDSSSFTVKNIRGDGNIVNIESIVKNIFILVESAYPFRIAVAHPCNIHLYIGSKKNSKIYNEFKKELKCNGGVCAELMGYFMAKDLHYIDISNKQEKDNSEPTGDLMRESMESFLKDFFN